MFWRFVISTLVVSLVAACGGEQASSPSTTEPDVPGTTTERTAPTTTEPPPTSTSTSPTGVEQPVENLAVLRPDGLGSVDFGTPADEALAKLSDLFGPPDREETIAPVGEGGDGCVEGAVWLDCLRDLRVVDQGLLAVWASHGLEVAMVDTSREAWPKERAPLQFGDWHATVARGDARLVTDEGLHPGMTVRELRQAAPGVEFGYNEGLLDSFFVTAENRGWYWGRLDWNPDTDGIEYWDVSAMQVALNEHGADLTVDGEWGPRSESAWLDLLSELGIQSPPLAAEWPLWLTPEIGKALGLPPGDITVATLGPRPTPETVAPSLPILRTDGLDRFDFGEPANELVDEMEAPLGPPSEDTSYTPDAAGPFDFLPLGYWATYELRIVVWEQPDLHLVLSDVPWLGDKFGEPTPGTLSLVSWETSSPEFTVDDQLAVGSSFADLQAHHPQVVPGTFDVCETEYNPAAFVTMPYDGDTPPLWRGLRGTTDWDWISDLQTALNERGASLAIDGEYGPRTSAAVAAFEQEIGVYHVDGQIDPEVADALSIQIPGNAVIMQLEAGYPGSC